MDRHPIWYFLVSVFGYVVQLTWMQLSKWLY